MVTYLKNNKHQKLNINTSRPPVETKDSQNLIDGLKLYNHKYTMTHCEIINSIIVILDAYLFVYLRLIFCCFIRAYISIN